MLSGTKYSKAKNLKCSIGFSFFDSVSFIVIASHFGNYFYSGIKKLNLGENFYDWTIENPTNVLVLVSSAAKTLPLESNTFSIGSYYSLIEQFNLSLNFITILTQLICVIALLRWSWTRIITLVYDIQHVMIFLLTGLLFWKWIWLNTAIIFAFTNLRGRQIPKGISYMAIIIMLSSPLFLTTAKLGWFDTTSVNNSYFVAITEDNRGVSRAI